MTVQELGETLKNRRKLLKITQPDLAELAGISPNTLYKLECGITNPSMDSIEKVASVLGLEIALIPKSSVSYKNVYLDTLELSDSKMASNQHIKNEE